MKRGQGMLSRYKGEFVGTWMALIERRVEYVINIRFFLKLVNERSDGTPNYGLCH